MSCNNNLSTVNSLIEKIDAATRVFLYILIFWLPYSSAVIESCVGFFISLFLIKSIIISRANKAHVSTVKNPFKFSFKIFSSIYFPIILFLVFSLVSAFMSTMQHRSVYAFFTKTLEWFIICYAVVGAVKERKHIYIIIGILMFTSCAVALDSIFQYFVWHKDIFNQQQLLEGRATASFGHSNGLGAYLTVILSLTAALILIKTQKILLRLIISLIFLSFLLSLFVSFSRGAWIASALGIVLIGLIVKPRMVKYAGVLLLIILILIFALPNQLLKSARIDQSNVVSTALWRFGVWEDTFKMIKAKPLLGHGPNTYSTIFQDYRRKEQGIHPYNPTNAHNCYLQIFAEIGILGLISFLWILVNFYRVFIASIRNFQRKFNFDFCLYVGLFAGVTAFLIHSFLDTNLYSLQLSAYLWYILGLLYVMAKIYKKDKIIN